MLRDRRLRRSPDGMLIALAFASASGRVDVFKPVAVSTVGPSTSPMNLDVVTLP